MKQDAWKTFNETRPPPKKRRWRGWCLRCQNRERAHITQLCAVCLAADIQETADD